MNIVKRIKAHKIDRRISVCRGIEIDDHLDRSIHCDFADGYKMEVTMGATAYIADRRDLGDSIDRVRDMICEKLYGDIRDMVFELQYEIMQHGRLVPSVKQKIDEIIKYTRGED